MIQSPKEKGEFFEIDPYGIETRGRMRSSFDALIERSDMIEDTEFLEEHEYTGKFKLTQGDELAQPVPMIHRRQLRIASGDFKSIVVKDEDITSNSIFSNPPEDAERVTVRTGKVAFRFSKLVLGYEGLKLQFIEKTFGRPSIEDLSGVGYSEIHQALHKKKEDLNPKDTALIRTVAHLLSSVHIPGDNEVILPDLGIHTRTFSY